MYVTIPTGKLKANNASDAKKNLMGFNHHNSKLRTFNQIRSKMDGILIFGFTYLNLIVC